MFTQCKNISLCFYCRSYTMCHLSLCQSLLLDFFVFEVYFITLIRCVSDAVADAYSGQCICIAN